jgi:hypothetical protein
MTSTTSDIYDGAPWTEMDIDDLKAAIEHGRSILVPINMFSCGGRRWPVLTPKWPNLNFAVA